MSLAPPTGDNLYHNSTKRCRIFPNGQRFLGGYGQFGNRLDSSISSRVVMLHWQADSAATSVPLTDCFYRGFSRIERGFYIEFIQQLTIDNHNLSPHQQCTGTGDQELPVTDFISRGSARIESASDHGCKNVLKGRNMNSPGLSEAQPRDSRCPQPTSRGGNVELVIMGSRGMHGKALVSTITAWTRCDSGPVRGSAGSVCCTTHLKQNFTTLCCQWCITISNSIILCLYH